MLTISSRELAIEDWRDGEVGEDGEAGEAGEDGGVFPVSSSLSLASSP